MKLPDNDKGTKTDLAQYRLSCAERDLRDAELLLSHEAFDSAVNRAYYAVFHAINAIHSLDGHGYKRHKDAIGNFNKNYVHTGIFPKEYGRLVVLAETMRRNSDYEDYYTTTKDEAVKQFHFAKEFFHAVKQYCEERYE